MGPVCRTQIQQSAWCAAGKALLEVIVVQTFEQTFVFLSCGSNLLVRICSQTPFILATLISSQIPPPKSNT